MSVAVPPDDVAPDHGVLLLVSLVVGAVQGEEAKRLELGLDPVEPGGSGRHVGELDVVGFGPIPTRLRVAPGGWLLRKKHPRGSWKQLRRRYLPGWWPTEGDKELFNPASTAVRRYRYRIGGIPTPWSPSAGEDAA